jgi:hypothetical protein
MVVCVPRQTVTVDEDSSFPFRAPEFFFFDPMRLDWADTVPSPKHTILCARTMSYAGTAIRRQHHHAAGDSL